MNPLTVSGVFAVSAMMLFYAVEDRSPHFVFAFGVVELVWSGVALNRWRQRLKPA